MLPRGVEAGGSAAAGTAALFTADPNGLADSVRMGLLEGAGDGATPPTAAAGTPDAAHAAVPTATVEPNGFPVLPLDRTDTGGRVCAADINGFPATTPRGEDAAAVHDVMYDTVTAISY